MQQREGRSQAIASCRTISDGPRRGGCLTGCVTVLPSTSADGATAFIDTGRAVLPEFRLAIAFAAALAAAACATSSPELPAPETAAAQSETSTEEASDGDRVVCKEIRKTGTRFGTRQCLTVAQWEAIQRGSREGVSEIQRRASHQQDMPGQGN